MNDRKRSLRFTGATNAPRSAPPQLPTNDPEEERLLFCEWVAQRWLVRTTPPDDRDALARFDWEPLQREFRREYSATRGRCVGPGQGAAPEEMVLFYQMRAREPYALLLNESQPQPPVSRIRWTRVWRGDELIGATMLFFAAAKLELDAYGDQGPAVPVMLYDGRSAHVITLRMLSDDGDSFSYDDPTWPVEGGSMLAPGQNVAGCEAWYLGEALGEWVVSAIDLSKVVFGIPLPLRVLPDWEHWLANYRQQLSESQAVLGKGFHQGSEG